MGLLKKAASKTKEAPKSKAKGTLYFIKDQSAVNKAISELIRLSREQKATEAKMDSQKTIIKREANDLYLTQFATDQIMPEAPTVLQDTDGNKVSFVVQDRSGAIALKDDQIELLNGILGEDTVADIVFEETTFSFNREIMAIPGVMDAVEKALTNMASKLVKDGTLTEEQSESLVDATTKRALRPGTVERLGYLCGKRVDTMKSVMDVLGSIVTRYIRV